MPVHRFSKGANIGGRGTAAATHDVEETFFCQLTQHGHHVVDAFTKAAKAIGQTSVWIEADVAVGHIGDAGDVGAQGAGAKGAVHAHN